MNDSEMVGPAALFLQAAGVLTKENDKQFVNLLLELQKQEKCLMDFVLEKLETVKILERSNENLGNLLTENHFLNSLSDWNLLGELNKRDIRTQDMAGNSLVGRALDTFTKRRVRRKGLCRDDAEKILKIELMQREKYEQRLKVISSALKSKKPVRILVYSYEFSIPKHINHLGLTSVGEFRARKYFEKMESYIESIRGQADAFITGLRVRIIEERAPIEHEEYLTDFCEDIQPKYKITH